MRKEHRAADLSLGVEEFVCWSSRARGVVHPAIGVENVVTGGKPKETVEIVAAGFGDRIDDNRSLGVFRAEIRRQNRKFLNHIRIRVHRRGAVATRVGHVSAVGRNVDVVDAGAVGHERTVERALAAAVTVTVDADYFPGEISPALQAIAIVTGSKARQDLDEFCCVAPDDSEIL